MPTLVIMGASMSCSMGAAPSKLIVARPNITAPKLPAGNIHDSKPIKNIPPFGLCKAPSNPAVQAIIASSSGATTQAPCLPALAGPWSPGAKKVTVDNQPALHDGCKLTCQWSGNIKIDDPGQTVVEVK